MQYYTFLRHKQFQQAYAMLSTALHARLSFNEFKQSMHYVLSNGCWALYQIVLSQVDKDGRTWDVGIEMACGSCAKDKNTVVWYDWEFQMIMEQHQTVIDFARIIPTLC